MKDAILSTREKYEKAIAEAVAEVKEPGSCGFKNIYFDHEDWSDMVMVKLEPNTGKVHVWRDNEIESSH